jgi:hypothetical protein
MLYVWSNGRLGSLRFSARKEGKALGIAFRVGELDARTCGRDQFSAVEPASTASVIAETSGDLSAEIDAYMGHIIMRSKISQVEAANRLPVRSIFATMIVVAIVVVVDWFLNEPLVARLGLPGYAIHISSVMIALASLVFAHYVVVGTPPGRRNRTRVVLIVLAVVGFLVFIVPGAYLRTTDASAGAGPDLSVGTQVKPSHPTFLGVLIGLIPIAVMLGLMLFTTAVAALIALRNETRKDQIRADGTGKQMAVLLTKAQQSTAIALLHKVNPLTRRLIHAHTSGFRSIGDARAIEIISPAPAALTEPVSVTAAEAAVIEGSEAPSADESATDPAKAPPMDSPSGPTHHRRMYAAGTSRGAEGE